jgi:hypothetical protein
MRGYVTSVAVNRNISGLSLGTFGNTTSKVMGPLVSSPGSDPADVLGSV